MDQGLLNRVLASPRLPSLPAVAVQILELVQADDVDINAIARAISHDPGLSSKILKTVNSSYYGLPRQVGTISKAVLMLGFDAVKTLALGFSLVGNLGRSGREGFDPIAFWRRSVYTAVAARSLAQHATADQREEAFLGGLLQDIGLLAMAHVLGHEYQALLGQAGGDHRKLLALEQGAYQSDHAQVGAALAQRWNLPPVLVEPIRYHTLPEDAPDDLKPLVRCVAMGCDVAVMFMDVSRVYVAQSFQTRAQEWLELAPDKSGPLLTTIRQETLEATRLFELPASEIEDPELILNRANEAMLQISLEHQQEAARLQQQNRHLAKQLVTDPLTGAANRRGLDDFVKEQFARAHASGGVLSLLFSDIDNFKGINDTYGHHVGDCALISLTSIIQELAQTNLVARFGGDEFAVVLPSIDRPTATHLAEAIRQRIADTAIESKEHGPVRMTVSIGVATSENGCFAAEKQLFLGADQALYAAKAGGRNGVRVYESPPAVRQDARRPA